MKHTIQHVVSDEEQAKRQQLGVWFKMGVAQKAATADEKAAAKERKDNAAHSKTIEKAAATSATAKEKADKKEAEITWQAEAAEGRKKLAGVKAAEKANVTERKEAEREANIATKAQAKADEAERKRKEADDQKWLWFKGACMKKERCWDCKLMADDARWKKVPCGAINFFKAEFDSDVPPPNWQQRRQETHREKPMIDPGMEKRLEAERSAREERQKQPEKKYAEKWQPCRYQDALGELDYREKNSKAGRTPTTIIDRQRLYDFSRQEHKPSGLCSCDIRSWDSKKEMKEKRDLVCGTKLGEEDGQERARIVRENKLWSSANWRAICMSGAWTSEVKRSDLVWDEVTGTVGVRPTTSVRLPSYSISDKGVVYYSV
jgi:hypothetical protein